MPDQDTTTLIRSIISKDTSISEELREEILKKNSDSEMLRYCSEKGYISPVEKVTNHFIKSNHPDKAFNFLLSNLSPQYLGKF